MGNKRGRDARLHENVLVQEDSRMDSVAGVRASHRAVLQRQVRAGRERPKRLYGRGVERNGNSRHGLERTDVFGKIRYMNYAGCKRKFKIEPFVARFEGASENAERALASSGKKLSGKKRKA